MNEHDKCLTCHKRILGERLGIIVVLVCGFVVLGGIVKSVVNTCSQASATCRASEAKRAARFECVLQEREAPTP